MKNINLFPSTLFQKIFELNSKNKIGSNTIVVFTFILYKCEELQKEIVLSDYEMARELGLSRQTVITAKNKLKQLGILDYHRNPGFPNRFVLNENELPKEIPKIVETKEISIEELYRDPEPKIIANSSFSRYPTLQQFMSFSKTLPNYSEKLDDVLIHKFHQWDKSDWKNAIGKPILDWRSVVEKNMIMFESHSSLQNKSELKIPNIKRPKVD
ncbi:cyclic nucleotide-binding domain-containing protein [Kaistella carnis]|uniref:Helix-turn-helix domain-containing protein n=1 Tax=Kaistella carnis TaxID=1241979 RepID=A0A3G8XS06_9FLAO|nr:helix-turn-helix domain-containing protein [Kaistella carnis]AZI33004.1 helix-turn-helix domain-containing protein [Kaistella carnis]